MKGHLLVIITATLLLIGSGCAYRPIPIATSYPMTAQHKMQAAHHWDVLAEHVAGRIKETLDLTFSGGTIKPAIFIRMTKDKEEIPFGKAFAGLLRSQLLQKGVSVVSDTNMGGTLLLDYDMLVIQHKDRRRTYPFPGTFSLLTGGVWLIARAADKWGGAAAFPAAAAADIYSAVDMYLPGETNTEVVISTTVTLGQQQIFGNSDIFYINTGDDDHYEKAGKTFSVVGCQQQSTCP